MNRAPSVVLWRAQIRDCASLSWRAKIAAYVLSTHMDKDGRNAWASVDTIRRGAGVSERTIQRGLRELEAENLVRALARTGRTTVYAARLAEGVSDSHPRASEGHPGASDSHPGGVSQAPELDLELATKSVTEAVGDPHGEIEEPSDEERLRSRRIRRGIEVCSDREALLAFAASDGAFLETLDFFSAISGASEDDKRAAVHARTEARLNVAA